MNCCDYDCNQGRDCPARSTPVARIGRKHQGDDPLPPSAWREQLRQLGKWVLITYALMFYVVIAAALLV